FDLFSIDLNLFEFQFLPAVLDKFRPRVVVSKYNAWLGPYADCVVPYVRGLSWDGTDYFGASYVAFERLADFFGYKILCCDTGGRKLFMVKRDFLSSAELENITKAYVHPGSRTDVLPHNPKRRRYLT